jgi:tRNA threonylcarbamoyladenosine biosynthesis protein TsaB
LGTSYFDDKNDKKPDHKSMILSIETSTEVCSVALHSEGKLLTSYELFTEKSHATSLTLLIDSILKQANVNMSRLKGVALSQGPGSYTGLRVGTSVAKGLCYALEIPLYAVSTLLAMAHTARQLLVNEDFLLCPMLDARRMEVYTLLTDSRLTILKPTQALIFEDTLMRELTATKKIVIFGNGAKKWKQASTNENLLLVENIYPSAKAIGDLFYLQSPDAVNIAYFEPQYLKEFFMPHAN